MLSRLLSRTTRLHCSRPHCHSSFIGVVSRPHLHFKSCRGFAKKVRVFNTPEQGEGTVEVDILEWFIKEGDKVSAFDVIGHGKYEKSDFDIYAPFDGEVKRLIIPQGNIARCHEPLIEFFVGIDGNDDDDDSNKEENESGKNKTSSSSSSSLDSIKAITETQTPLKLDGSSKIIKALPSARHLAKQNEIDLSVITATGNHGQILKEDVLNHIDNQNKGQQQQQQQIKKEDRVEKIIGVKRAMVKFMAEANKIPQFGYGDEVIMNALIETRKQINESLQKNNKGDVKKLSFLPFIIKAASLSLSESEFTCLNAHVNSDCSELIHRASHNIGVAVDSPDGLVVPNIKDCQNKSILEIALDLNELIERARNRKLTQDDTNNGTFTLSNIGAIAGTYCSPVVFPPQVCIGALGASQQWPRYHSKTGKLYKAAVMPVSWSADHRVIDGATVARFSNQWKEYLEDPSKMVLNLR